MDELVKVEKSKDITSLELVKQINIFREQEGKKTLLQHKSMLSVIRDEFEEEISLQKILPSEYTNSRGKKYPIFNLTFSQAKQVLMRESKFVRKATVKYIENLEKQLQILQPKLPSTYKEALIELLAKVEENEKLLIENKTQKDYIDHVVINKKYYITPTVIGNKFGMSGAKINKILQELQVQYKQGKKWCLKKDYYGIGDYGYYQKPNGEWEKGSSLRFTNEGERTIYDILIMHGYETTK